MDWFLLYKTLFSSSWPHEVHTYSQSCGGGYSPWIYSTAQPEFLTIHMYSYADDAALWVLGVLVSRQRTLWHVGAWVEMPNFQKLPLGYIHPLGMISRGPWMLCTCFNSITAPSWWRYKKTQDRIRPLWVLNISPFDGSGCWVHPKSEHFCEVVQFFFERRNIFSMGRVSRRYIKFFFNISCPTSTEVEIVGSAMFLVALISDQKGHPHWNIQ